MWKGITSCYIKLCLSDTTILGELKPHGLYMILANKSTLSHIIVVYALNWPDNIVKKLDKPLHVILSVTLALSFLTVSLSNKVVEIHQTLFPLMLFYSCNCYECAL